MKPYNPNLRVGIVSLKTKTMLKRNLVRTSFLSPALLFVLPNVSEVKGESLHSYKEKGNALLTHSRLKKDSMIQPGAKPANAGS